MTRLPILLATLLLCTPAATGQLDPAPDWSRQGVELDLEAMKTAFDQPARPGLLLVDGGQSGDSRGGEFAFSGPARSLKLRHTWQPGEGIDHYRRAAALAKRSGNLPPQPPTLLRYEVEYEDGVVVPIDVRWGEGVGDWYRFVDEPMPLPWAKPISVKTDLAGQPAEPTPSFLAHQVVYEMTWPNPRPSVAIREVRVASAERPWEELGQGLVLGVRAADAGPERVRVVAPFGDDAAAGSFDAPWRTPGRAIEGLEPGDLVLFRGGRYGILEQLFIRDSGSAEAPISIASFPGETAIIDAELSPVPLPGSGGHGPASDAGQIALDQAKHVRIVGLQVQNSGSRGIRLRECEDIEILGCRTYRTYSSGIADLGGKNIRLIGNTIARPTSKLAISGATAEILTPEKNPHEGITLGNTDGFELAWNEVYASDKEGIDGKGSTRHGRIHHNLVYRTASTGIYLDCWRDMIKNVEIDRNTVFETGGISVGSEVTLPVENIDIHHNLVYRSTNGISTFNSIKDWMDESHERAEDTRPRNREFVIRFNTVCDNGEEHARRQWFGGGILLRDRSYLGLDVVGNIVADNFHAQIVSEVRDFEQKQVSIADNLQYPFIEVPARDADVWPGVAGEGMIEQPPRFTAPDRGLFFLEEGSPARLALAVDGERVNFGAFAGRWRGDAGLDPNTQRVLPGYEGPWRFEPLHIPERLRNAHVDRAMGERNWFHLGGLYILDLTSFPTGRQMLGGVEWQLPYHSTEPQPDVVMLAGQGSYIEAGKVEGMPVGRKADALFFLQAYNPGPALGEGETPVVLRYVIHYADGEQTEAAVRWMREIGPWISDMGEPVAVPGAEVAWYNAETYHRFRGEYGIEQLAVYAMEWENPRPDVAIERVDFVAADEPGLGAAAVMAVTAAERN